MKLHRKIRFLWGAFLNNMFDRIYFRKRTNNPRCIEMELLSNSEGRLLDLCTGTGTNLKYIVKANPKLEVTASDISMEQLKYCKRRLSKCCNHEIEYRQMDCSRLKYEKESFNYVTIGFSLHEMNLTTRKQVVSEVTRVLKQQGIFIVLEWSGLGTKAGRGKIRSCLLRRVESKHYEEFLQSNFRDLFIENGLILLQEESTDFSNVFVFQKI